MSWNGHYLVGYSVAIVLTALIGTGSAALFTGTDWVTWTHHPTAPPGAPAASAAPVASSCDRLQEAILTGSEADIIAGMHAVLADRTIDNTSRKIAKYYTGRDRADKSGKKRDLLIIRDSCSR